MTAIEIAGLGFAYHGSPVLTGVTLAVNSGEIYGLVGADGAGKTTLLQLAVGQLPPQAGRITVLGRDAADPALRNEIAYMPQGFGLYRDLSVQENLDFFADLHGLTPIVARERIVELLKRAGLAGFEERRAAHLSGGMMQKLALACALVSQPRAMFLDEPTTGVDPVSRRAFWRLLNGVRAEGVAILYATANMDEAERCDRVGLLEAGRLERQGTPLELTHSVDAQLVGVSGATARQRREALLAWPMVQLAFPVGRQLRVWLGAGGSLTEFQARLRALDPELDAQPLQPTLQDAALRELALAEAGFHAG
ncbi:MAG TPA: ATP-binding cassette domain-containing protein [Candidatus Competibacteraceae bacterium]|nr:ATP-binding cassette domain-containing protein [Candidatus Competibacteraceae bacterium]HRZ05222.1 ATP-binding cassette domain-containing protein [Candidatus Competibacteraceae bacterium]HSA45127.1 ATP-binding cassette domain-containing protein [Candidatus Competibacteraceae bacterium]